MLSQFAPVLILAILAVGFGLLVLALSHFIGPRRPNAIKQSTYESGLVPVGPGTRRVPVRFYLVATLFILFDIEVIYLFPWAVQFKALARPAPEGVGVSALWPVAVFVFVLLLGLIHVWRRGALDWSGE